MPKEYVEFMYFARFFSAATRRPPIGLPLHLSLVWGDSPQQFNPHASNSAICCIGYNLQE